MCTCFRARRARAHPLNHMLRPSDILKRHRALPTHVPLLPQEFVTEAMEAMQEEAAFSDDEIFDASMVQVDQDDDDDDDIEDYSAFDVQEAYGDGLVALLQHLSADRRSTVQAWLQLKDDIEGKTYHESTWTNLSALEEDFLLINSEHRVDAPYGPIRSTVRT